MKGDLEEFARRGREAQAAVDRAVAAAADGVTVHAALACPICGYTIDAAGTFAGPAIAPRMGDWTCCGGCFAWLVYLGGDGALALRPVTNAEWLALEAPERVILTEQRERVRRAFRR